MFISDNWKLKKFKNLSIFYPGEITENKIFEEIYFKIKNGNQNIHQILQKYKLRGLVVESEKVLFAVTDHCKSYSIFFLEEKNEFIISDNIKNILNKKKNLELEDSFKLELLMSGYISDNRTIFKKIKQLEAGTQLIFFRNNNKMKIHKYFYYLKIKKNYMTEQHLDILDLTLNKIFNKIIKKHQGSRIIVPLSGGIDSRLVLSKLVELKHDKILAVSYGPKESQEVKIAKKISKRLNIKWLFVNLKRNDYKNFFVASKKINYWKFCDFYSSLPNNQDIIVFKSLKKNGFLNSDDVIINGQTGDFISGGHIPSVLTKNKSSIKDVINAIIEKHYGLSRNLLTKENKNFVYKIISSSLKKIDTYKPSLDEYYEFWEYEQRQSKFIVSGQKAYDYLNIKWELPFWDINYVNFWRKVPTSLKINQKLYKSYLKAFDYQNIFTNIEFQNQGWSLKHQLWIRPFSFFLKKILGKSQQKTFIEFAKFFDSLSHYYSSYGFFTFLKNYKNIRNPNSLFVKDWVNLIEREIS